MANFNVEGAQNVEISKKIPCEKPLIVQLGSWSGIRQSIKPVPPYPKRYVKWNA